jgi:hypothetical protein
MRFPGVLQPLVDSIQRQASPPPGGLVGQVITVTGRSETPYIALDADGHLHFLLAPRATDEVRLHRFRRRSLEIANRPWVVSGKPVHEFLDLTFLAPVTSPVRRPFLSFCEDILVDLEKGGSPEEAVHRTCLRWQRFWAEDDSEALSLTWLLGLMGELVVLRALISMGGPGVVGSWTGPEALDHDFQSGNRAAIEVKTTTRLPAEVECNLKQLDPGVFETLLLAAVLAKPVAQGGTTVSSLRTSIEAELNGHDEELDLFLAKLARAGHRHDREDAYAAHPFDLGEPTFHLVDENFPRITHASFRKVLDARIQGVRYQLELTGLTALPVSGAVVQAVCRELASQT